MLRTPKTDESVVIYETLKLRATGSHTQVIDLRPQGGKYALRCVTHDHTVERNVRLATEAESHRSHDWCPSCVKVEKKAAPKAANPMAQMWANVFAPTRDERLTVEFILDTIGRATSQKKCEEKVNAALAA